MWRIPVLVTSVSASPDSPSLVPHTPWKKSKLQELKDTFDSIRNAVRQETLCIACLKTTMFTEYDNFQETDNVVNIPDGSSTIQGGGKK
ncbi:hypothetical protein K1719_000463 [Acacia pycnantha]|nr:hypothetical protein K1719_000463 [Acacia pycnantha]